MVVYTDSTKIAYVGPLKYSTARARNVRNVGTSTDLLHVEDIFEVDICPLVNGESSSDLSAPITSNMLRSITQRFVPLLISINLNNFV